MARIEHGDPSVAMASYVMCMWLINQADGLADLIAPQNDHAALEKQVAQVRAKRKPGTRKVSTSSPIAAFQALKVAQDAGPWQPPEAERHASAKAGPAAGLAALMAKTSSQA